MPFDYEANVAAVRSAMLTRNTTTANPDLSSGLTTRVRNIFISNPDVNLIRWNDLPAIYVRVQVGNEEPSGLGATGPQSTNAPKFKEVAYELIGLYARDGARTEQDDHETQIYRLAENLEGVFQREFTLSGTALWCHPERTDFGAFQAGEGLRVRGIVTTLRAKYFFR